MKPVQISKLPRGTPQARRVGTITYKWPHIVFEELRFADGGAIQDFTAPMADCALDSTGNLETIPSYRNSYAYYPMGRVYHGSWNNSKPGHIDFFAAQESQAPLGLDTDLWYAGHVNEFMQFIPADNEGVYVLVVDDTRISMDLLLNATASGHGNVKAVSRGFQQHDRPIYCIPEETINDILGFVDFSEDSEYATRSIGANLVILKREIDLAER